MQISYFQAKLYPPNSILAGAALQTPLGELAALPRLDLRGILIRERKGPKGIGADFRFEIPGQSSVGQS